MADQKFPDEELFADLYPPNKGTMFEGDNSLCEDGQRFLHWAEKRLAALRSQVQPVASNARPSVDTLATAIADINKFKVELLDKYFEIRRLAPKNCQQRMKRSNGHTCIFNVFEETYKAIVALKVPLSDPFYERPRATTPTVVTKADPLIYLGDEEFKI